MTSTNIVNKTSLKFFDVKHVKDYTELARRILDAVVSSFSIPDQPLRVSYTALWIRVKEFKPT